MTELKKLKFSFFIFAITVLSLISNLLFKHWNVQHYRPLPKQTILYRYELALETRA